MDNGGKFANDEMQELGNQYGINIKHTAAYGPWSNGLNKRNHATNDIIMKKIFGGLPNVDKNKTFQHAVSVTNCCLYVPGFTPAQLAIGQNLKLPSTFHNSLPTLEGCTTSSIIAQNLNDITTSHKTFVHTETSAKVKKALKHPVRQYCVVVFKHDDNVFYK